MSLSNRSFALLLALLWGCLVHQAVAADVCPVREPQPLRFVDVFDGPPKDLATLIPDKGGEHSGYWLLGYIYDAGRFVVIRCKYADKQMVDVKLSEKVNKCEYKIDEKKTLRVYCK